MKQLLKRTLSFLLVSAIVCTLFSGVFTASAASYSYNSGKRGELCTALSAQAKSYYTESYTYDKLSSLSAASLRTTLRSLVTNGRTTVGYGGLRDYHKYTDAYQGSSSKLVLFYCNGAANSAWDSGKTWNREHMWPDSLGGSAMEGDLHAMRPTDPNLNSTRGNKRYGEVNNGTAAKAGSNNGSLLGGYSGSNAFEPLDFAKGDCARVVLYDYVVTNSMSSVTTVFTDIDTLLAWCLLDPVDEFEMSRNDVAQEIENCRNPFVDYPELAWILFGKEVPAGMSTPSGEAGNSTVCQHTATHTVTTDPTCTANGKIETVCNACGEVIATETLAKLGHEYKMTTVEPTCSEKGYDLYSCIRCDNTYKDNYTDTVDHIDTDGDLACDYCGTEVIPVCTHENTHEERTEPTCEKAGSVKTICDACGETVATETLAKLGHEYEMTTVEPTCTEKGYDLYSCIRCDDEYKKNYTNKVDHQFLTTTVAPTCSDRGYDLHICTFCNAEYRNNYTDKVDHIDEDGNKACDFCGTAMNIEDEPEDCLCQDYYDIGHTTWYHDAAIYAIENGLMNGVAPHRFDPNGIVTRAMLVTILYRVEGEPSVDGLENPFADVKENSWYTNAIIWAADRGLVNGISATAYAPDKEITREQIAAILYRYAKFKGEDVTCEADLSTFPDADEISAYAVEPIRWAVGNGIINGINGTISPVAIAFRVQIATMLMRYLEK